MGKISEFTQQDHEIIARDYADLKEAARKRCTNEEELEVIQKAFEFANELKLSPPCLSMGAFVIL